ncbi:SelB C-terminal domain-containing protein [Desulfococcus sp.]|uniref:selenocysteine-specific translation elongation factor n=1 Tax=Desulfococcus sp. TaxID=2025834 RepID=UPI0035946A8B
MNTHITIGVAGHVDHGKTALVRSLTGVDTDRMKEEKERGLSIESGVAPLFMPGGARAALIDVPGHTDFLKNTIRGLCAVDLAVLVVAADDGVMPQTVEHLNILTTLGAAGGLVVVGKSDLVDAETLELARMEVEDLVRGTFLEGKPVVPFSARTEQGRSAVLGALEAELALAGGKRGDAPFRLWIDQVRQFPGLGTVVSGTVLGGALTKNDAVDILPRGIRTRAKSLEVHGEPASYAFAGQRVGVNLHRVPLSAVRRGSLLARADTLNTATLINAELKMLRPHTESIDNRQMVKLYLGTAVVAAMIVTMETEVLEPGDTGLVQCRLASPVPALPGDRFLVSPMNRAAVIAGGRVLKTSKVKYRAGKAKALLPYLRALQSGRPEEILARLLDRHPYRPVTEGFAAEQTGLSPEICRREIERRVEGGEWLSLGEPGAVGKAAGNRLREMVLQIVAQTLRQDALRVDLKAVEIGDKLPADADRALIHWILAGLCREGRLIQEGGGYRMAEVTGRLTSTQMKLVEELHDFAAKAGITPFTAHTAWRSFRQGTSKRDVEKLLGYLARQHRLVRLNNDRFLSPEALEEIMGRVRAAISCRGHITANDCNAILGYGRTGALPVLEYLDEIGFTERRGNDRMLVSNGENAPLQYAHRG